MDTANASIKYNKHSLEVRTSQICSVTFVYYFHSSKDKEVAGVMCISSSHRVYKSEEND